MDNIRINHIVTHAGMFHADEVLGIALILRYFPHATITRTNKPTVISLEDPETIVLDVGGELDYAKGNLDHHQNIGIPAACILAVEYLLMNRTRLNIDFPESLHEFFKADDGLFKLVSDIDRGLVTSRDQNSFNSLIRGMNGLVGGFNKALELSRLALTSLFNTYNKLQRAKHLWSKCGKATGCVINLTGESIVGWTGMAKEEDILFMITPGRENGQYNLISRDSKEFPIKKDFRQVFLHPSRFLAVYPSMDAALIRAKELYDLYNS